MVVPAEFRWRCALVGPGVAMMDDVTPTDRNFFFVFFAVNIYTHTFISYPFLPLLAFFFPLSWQSHSTKRSQRRRKKKKEKKAKARMNKRNARRLSKNGTTLVVGRGRQAGSYASFSLLLPLSSFASLVLLLPHIGGGGRAAAPVQVIRLRAVDS